MENFVEAARIAGVSALIDSVFFDSKNCVCVVNVASHVTEASIAGGLLKRAAHSTLGQYSIFGDFEHGERM
ncbi:hypothetical protein [Allohahella marinimesophila]|uniref:Uncharacterized protein n=1 Tax=Allohahella marinimesophila TaxID=1054972 RepID=A0ABP7Q7I0_9GAMM